MSLRGLEACRLIGACALAASCSLDLAPLASGGAGGGSSSCDAYCARSVAQQCNPESVEACAASCNDGQLFFSRCAEKYADLIECGAKAGSFVCDDGIAVLANCEVQQDIFYDCIWGIQPVCAASTPVSGGGCYGGTSCNPIKNSCQSGSVCDWSAASGAYQLVCKPAGGPSAAACDSCDDDTGPWCQPGHSCVGSAATTKRCAKYCCNDADCGGAPGSCTRWGDTTLFFCAK